MPARRDPAPAACGAPRGAAGRGGRGSTSTRTSATTTPTGSRPTPRTCSRASTAPGSSGALVFPAQEPAGYPPANDRVLAACAGVGRPAAGARADRPERRRTRSARRAAASTRGARGFKLHPRSDGFELPHPVVEEVVALAGEARAAVLFHAGRGIPHLGESVVHMAREHPGARLILAHAGISDTGWIAPYAAELPNLFFDTAWWQVGDLLALFAHDPARPDPLRERHAVRQPALPLARLPALRAERRPRRRRAARDRRRVRPSACSPARTRSTSARRRAPRSSARATSTFERVVAHAAVAANLSFRGRTSTRRSRSPRWPATAPTSTRWPCAVAALLDAGRRRRAWRRDAATRRSTPRSGAQLLAGTPDARSL